MEEREAVQKFEDLNLIKREWMDRCIVKGKKLYGRLHDLLLELCKNMKVEEQQT